MKRIVLLALASLLALEAAVACGAAVPEPRPNPSATAAPGRESAIPGRAIRTHGVVTRIEGGETLVLSLDGRDQSVHLLAIETPDADLGQCFADAANSFVSAVIPPGSPIEVEQDVSDLDASGRLLRYVYLPDGSMLNEQFLRGGFARLSADGPDRKYLERLRDAEDEARAAGLGLWACDDDLPANVAARTATATATPTPAAPPVAAAVVGASPTRTPTPVATRTPASTPVAVATAAPTSPATPAPTAPPTSTPVPTPAPTPAATTVPAPPANCHPSYPTVCIPPAPPDLDCGEISFRRFQVLPPDPHRFDNDHDGIGCES